MGANPHFVRLDTEARARLAIAREIAKVPCEKKKMHVGPAGPKHEFDIFAEGVVIGGVTTGTYLTSGGSINTGCTDRVCAELLWLTLWPGEEQRLMVLMDRPMADWLKKRFTDAPFPHQITVLHYDPPKDQLTHMGWIG